MFTTALKSFNLLDQAKDGVGKPDRKTDRFCSLS